MTTQTRERIEHNGIKYYLGGEQYPLELLLKDDREVHHSCFSWLDLPDIPDEEKIPRPDFTAINKVRSTNCWRGYTGEWIIHNGILCLKDIKGLVDIGAYFIDGAEPKKPESLLHHVFPEHVGLVEATWFTGPLDLCSGGYYTQGLFIETEVLSLKIEKGQLMSHEKFISEPREELVPEPRKGWVRHFIIRLKTLVHL